MNPAGQPAGFVGNPAGAENPDPNPAGAGPEIPRVNSPIPRVSPQSRGCREEPVAISRVPNHLISYAPRRGGTFHDQNKLELSFHDWKLFSSVFENHFF